MDIGGNGELGPELNWNEVNLSISGGWTPLDSVVQNVERTSPVASCGQTDNSSFTDVLQSQGTSRTSHLVQFQSYCGLAGLEPNLSCFGSARVSEMDNFFIQQRCHAIANFGYSADYPKEESGIETDKPSPDGKKRNWSQFSQSKNMKTDQKKDQCIAEQNKEKLKPARKPDAPKEDYVHVRAQRGQATTRHSLAERVRREKIRERMKFLQDLVPGCSKISGKAVMLDEIINYVISLQRQVEFLSTKLATAYPEMNVDLEQTLSRDIHHSQGSRAAIPADLGMSSYPKEMLQGALLVNQTKLEPPNMLSLVSIWDNELVNTSQMDFNHNPTLHNPDFNDCDEVEL